MGLKLWRGTTETTNAPSHLLAQRTQRQLGLLIPTTYTNVQQVGLVRLPLRSKSDGIKAAPCCGTTDYVTPLARP